MKKPRFVQFVVKVSKLCNLRCQYCYEFPELAKRDAMKLEQLCTMYSTIRDYYSARDREDGEQTEVRFIWHGGEPLLQAPAFYRTTFSDQRAIFGDAHPLANIVQTNLTVLDEERIELLRNDFDKVGVSVDLFGDLRVDTGGKPSQRKVLDNLERLRQAGVEFGTITVLTQANLPHLRKIWNFYERSRIQFRILPLFDGAFEDQHESYDITTRETLDAYNQMVDWWLDSESLVGANPIVEHIQSVLKRFSADESPSVYSRRAWIPTILVNTNGDCFAYGDPYGDPEWCYGNIFREPLTRILSSPAFERSVHESEKRMAKNCVHCPYFGGCDGYPIAEDVTNCREYDAEGVRVCVLERGAMEHIERRLRERGVIGPDDRVRVDEAAAFRLGMEVKTDSADRGAGSITAG
jgi:uncharacterized protein